MLYLGWSNCADAVMALIKPNRLVSQLPHFVQLAMHLLERHCFQGAAEVGDRLAFLTSSVDEPIEPSHIDLCLKLFHHLNLEPKTANMARFSALLPMINFSQQLQLSDNIPVDLMKAVASCLFRLEDAGMLTSFINPLFALPNKKHNSLLSALVSSLKLRELATNSAVCRDAFLRLLERRIANIKAYYTPAFNFAYPKAIVPGDRALQKFLRSSKEQLTVRENFGDIGQAEAFMQRLDDMGRSHSFSVKTWILYGAGGKLEGVVIYKTNEFHEEMGQRTVNNLRLEKDQLMAFRRKLAKVQANNTAQRPVEPQLPDPPTGNQPIIVVDLTLD